MIRLIKNLRKDGKVFQIVMNALDDYEVRVINTLFRDLESLVNVRSLKEAKEVFNEMTQ